MEILEYTITEEKGRLDKVLVEAFPQFSRSQIQAWLKEDRVTVNDDTSRANYKVKADDKIVINRPEPQVIEAVAQDLPLEIIYEALRKYVALVHGEIPHEKGTITAPIGRSKDNRQKQAVIGDGKPAVTHFTVLERFEEFTLVECQLETGRTHQIRVHMDYIGFPIAGDPLYGPKKTLPGPGQFLHAKTLGFEHPVTHEEMIFSSDVPEVFEETLENLRQNRWF